MPFLEWLYFAAAAWYISYAVTHTHGPFGVFERLREFNGGRWHGRSLYPTKIIMDGTNSRVENEIQKDGLLDCIICLMPWVALILYLIGVNVVTSALAIAGLALWLHGYSGWRHTSHEWHSHNCSF
jgi:hypothetical protein